VGGWVKQLYDTLAQLRDAKKQAADIAARASDNTSVKAAAKIFTDKAVAVEGDMTQLQGEANQDALNFPGRLDNQLTQLYVNIIRSERRLGTMVNERYVDLKPQFTGIMTRAATVLKNDVATFNAAAGSVGSIVIK